MTKYTTIQDVIEQEIGPALGDHAHEYDVEAIARATYEYQVATDGDGNETLNTAGFYPTVDVDEFWQVAQRHPSKAQVAKRRDEVYGALRHNVNHVTSTLFHLLVHLGSRDEWDVEDNFTTTETVAALAEELGLPSATAVTDFDLAYWRALNSEWSAS